MQQSTIHDPRRHFAIQFIIAGPGGESELVSGGLKLEPRAPKRDAQVLRLLTHGDATAAIIRQHDDGSIGQAWIKEQIA